MIFFIDFKSAFDSISHNILFQKLEKLGISKEIINSIKILYQNTSVNNLTFGRGVI